MNKLRPFVFEVVAVVLVLGLGGAVGRVLGDSEAEYLIVKYDLDSIRSAFNAKSGSVRAVLLASPT